jgi:chromosome segregation ATPase
MLCQKEPSAQTKGEKIMKTNMSITRILKLAKKYGPFVRFSPDGNEDAAAEALKAAEKADLENNDEFNKVKQQAAQHEANATKAREATEAANSQLTEATSQNEALKTQLAEAQSKAAQSGVGVELKESDYSDTDIALVRSIKNIQKQLEAKDVEIGNLNKKASDFESNKATETAKATQEAQYQELLDDMDNDYGPEHRNAAVAMFQKKLDAGEVKGGAAKATRILEKCYKDIVAAEKAKDADANKGKVRLDSGQGGGTPVTYGDGVELTAGSLEDVTAQAGKLLNKSG